MLIDWANFTPWTALGGGAMLGIAAALFVLLSGRVLGISGIVGGLLRPRSGDIGWRVAVLLGLFAAPLPYLLWGGGIPARIDAGWGTLVVAGLLVGAGTSSAAGCTSGHGVCGLSRLSPRSAVATLSFMAAGFATVYLVRHAIAA